MKSKWNRLRVSDLILSKQLFIGDGYRAKNEELSAGGLPFARGGNINNGFRFDDADGFPTEKLARVGNKVSQPGDVVFTSKGTVGRFAFVTQDTPQFVYSPQLCFWRSLNLGAIHPRFLYYWMFGSEFFGQFKGVAGQTDMAEYVSLTDQRRMHITLPPLPEQKAIARILGSLDDKIELNRRMNATLENLAQTLFRAWFVDFEPVKAAGLQPVGMDTETVALFPSEFEDSSLGPIPKGWKIESLDSVATFVNGLALQKYRPKEGENRLPVIKIAQLKRGVADENEWATSQLDPAYIVQDGDMLFSWSGSLEIVLWAGGGGSLNQHLFKVTSENYPQWFYYFWTSYHLPEFRNIAADKATTMGHIQRRHLTEAKVLVPPTKLLRRVSNFFTPILKRQLVNRLESRTLAQLRDSLLPRLISGELRVPEAQELAEG